MATHTYDVTIDGQTYTVNSESPLSDTDAYSYARQQHESDITNDPVAQRARIDATNKTARANMAKQPTEAELQARAVSEPWTAAAMADRATAGAKGEAEGFGTGLAAPVLMLAHAIRHPLDTVDSATTAAAALGGAAYNAAADPAGTADAAKHAVVRFASDPENIGSVAGGADAMLALGGFGASRPGLVSTLADSKVGQAVAAGVSDAANRIPGVKVARAILSPTAKVPKLTAAQTRAAEEAARLSANGVVPVADAASSAPDIAAATRRTPYAPVQGPTEAERVQSLVVPTADASASNPAAIARATDAAPYPVADAPLDPHAAVRDLVVPTADAAASMPTADTWPANNLRNTMRRPYEPLPPDSPLAKIREQLGLRLDRANDPTFATDAANPLPDLRAGDPAYPQEGLGGRGQEAVVKGPAAPSDLVTVPAAAAAPTRGLEATLTAEERALIGNRSAGALTMAERKALLDEMLKRSAQ